MEKEFSPLQRGDIQGLVYRTFGTKKFSRYISLTVNNSSEAKNWLYDLIPFVTTNQKKKGNDDNEVYLNISFSYYGLSKFGVNENILKTFDDSFAAGSLSAHTTRMLGDTGVNAPQNWQWGKTEDEMKNSIHVLLFVFGCDENTLNNYCDNLILNLRGLSVYKTWNTEVQNDSKEHFGFADGIAQPNIFGEEKISHETSESNTVAAGEFVLGYKNEYNILPESPVLDAELDKNNYLPYSEYAPGKKDLGMNGTYVVFRQLQEDVKQFRDFLKTKIAENQFIPTPHTEEQLAAKMMGRFPDGTPITKCPFHEQVLPEDNNFLYANKNEKGEDDVFGMRCPLGAHIRRANPRDVFNDNAKDTGNDAKQSLVFSKKHRLIRRGRPYGIPIVPSMNWEEILNAEIKDGDTDRGIFFICLQANLQRQFEFVQQTWITNPQLRDAQNDPDPFMGSPDTANEEGSFFTIQAEPVRQRISGIKSFVTVKGSAYFFMPGISALKFLTSL